MKCKLCGIDKEKIIEFRGFDICSDCHDDLYSKTLGVSDVVILKIIERLEKLEFLFGETKSPDDFNMAATDVMQKYKVGIANLSKKQVIE